VTETNAFVAAETRPAIRPKPPGSVYYDADVARAARAAAAESSRAVFTFKCRGVVIDVPPAGEWPLSVMDAIAEADIPRACRSLFAPEQWAALADAGATLADLIAVFDRLAEWQGLTDLGN
jgi:transaldolase